MTYHINASSLQCESNQFISGTDQMSSDATLLGKLIITTRNSTPPNALRRHHPPIAPSDMVTWPEPIAYVPRLGQFTLDRSGPRQDKYFLISAPALERHARLFIFHPASGSAGEEAYRDTRA